MDNRGPFGIAGAFAFNLPVGERAAETSTEYLSDASMTESVLQPVQGWNCGIEDVPESRAGAAVASIGEPPSGKRHDGRVRHSSSSHGRPDLLRSETVCAA